MEWNVPSSNVIQRIKSSLPVVLYGIPGIGKSIEHL